MNIEKVSNYLKKSAISVDTSNIEKYLDIKINKLIDEKKEAVKEIKWIVKQVESKYTVWVADVKMNGQDVYIDINIKEFSNNGKPWTMAEMDDNTTAIDQKMDIIKTLNKATPHYNWKAIGIGTFRLMFAKFN